MKVLLIASTMGTYCIMIAVKITLNLNSMIYYKCKTYCLQLKKIQVVNLFFSEITSYLVIFPYQMIHSLKE